MLRNLYNCGHCMKSAARDGESDGDLLAEPPRAADGRDGDEGVSVIPSSLGEPESKPVRPITVISLSPVPRKLVS